MDKLKIVGGQPLEGDVYISGAKNAVLPIMCAALLSEKEVVLKNVPGLSDVLFLEQILHSLGSTTHFNKTQQTLTLHTPKITSSHADYELVRKMRASVLVLGPLLGRTGEATVSLPGGCALGARPIDIHLEGLKALGATIDIEHGYVHAKAPKGLKGAEFTMSFPSVGATENLMMAAVLAQGATVLRNVAREPEIVDLAAFLNTLGANITGAGTDTLTIEGVATLNGGSHTVLADRIEAGTYAAAALLTNGNITIHNASFDALSAYGQALISAGAKITKTDNGFSVKREGPVQPVDVVTEPYPGFHTDLQAQFMALMTMAEGTAVIRESIFENRFMHVPELVRLGAQIKVNGDTAIVRGVKKLSGTSVMATDLRASVSLVICGLAAQGETVVNRIYHLDRGYEQIEAKLCRLGAQVERIS